MTCPDPCPCPYHKSNAWPARDGYAFTIGPEDVGPKVIKTRGAAIFLALQQTLGRIQPNDVEKRVYRRGDILQVESNQQRDARIAQERKL